jgi:hypothetical protein
LHAARAGNNGAASNAGRACEAAAWVYFSFVSKRNDMTPLRQHSGNITVLRRMPGMRAAARFIACQAGLDDYADRETNSMNQVHPGE